MTADDAEGTDDDAGTISGAITNFMTGDMEQDWMVALLSTPLNPDGAPAGDDTPAVPHFDTSDADPSSGYAAKTNAGTVWSMGDRDAAADGNWSGTFYVGVDKAPRNDGTPDGAAGEFAAAFEDQGRMVGAFGAINTTPDTTP